MGTHGTNCTVSHFMMYKMLVQCLIIQDALALKIHSTQLSLSRPTKVYQSKNKFSRIVPLRIVVRRTLLFFVIEDDILRWSNSNFCWVRTYSNYQRRYRKYRTNRIVSHYNKISYFAPFPILRSKTRWSLCLSYVFYHTDGRENSYVLQNHIAILGKNPATKSYEFLEKCQKGAGGGTVGEFRG